MFTGIIEQIGQLVARKVQGSNNVLTFRTPLASELKIDQSLSHNGVCLTVTAVKPNDEYEVVAVEETLLKSNLGKLEAGDPVNLERAMIWGHRLDGHLVQGHVDTVARCTGVLPKDGSWVFSFEFDAHQEEFVVVEKGSICVNGISLTCFNTTERTFDVAIIPYTFEHTNFNSLKPNSTVNLEFDIVGKYIQRMMRSQRN